MKNVEILYTIEYKEEIIAISESKKDIENFYIQNNYYYDNNYTIHTINKRKDIDLLLMVYNELYIHKIEYGYILDIDIDIFNDIVYRELSNIYNTIEGLKNIRLNGNILYKKEINIIDKTINIINKYHKADKLIDYKGILQSIYNINSLDYLYTLRTNRSHLSNILCEPITIDVNL